MAAIQVTCGGITFNGSADGNGTFWKVQSVDGWEGATPRQTFHPKLGASGEVIGEANLGPRAVTLTGNVMATSQANAWTAFNSLVTASDNAVSASTTLTVAESGGSKSLTVYTHMALKLAWVTDRFFRSTIAPNPVKA
jgi:hypothetical protein